MKHFLNVLRNFLFFYIRYPWVEYGSNVHCQWTTTMFSPNKKIIFGNNVGIGRYCDIQSDLVVGNCVMIASNVALLGKDAHTFDRIGLTMWDSPRGDKTGITIEDDVWIGSGAIILSGVTIGRGSIVAAGAIITKDVPRYSIVGGPPAKVIGMRFTESQIVEHERLLSRCAGN